jgi:1-deoxy-D-xylulose-5-phosphate synthase
LDENSLRNIFATFENIITIEDGVNTGGFGSAILEFSALHNYTSRIKTLGIPDQFITQGTVNELQKMCGIDADSLVEIFSKYGINCN